MRLMLPAWLGADEALKRHIDAGQLALIQQMYQQWPFFRTYIDMLEMVVYKADAELAEYYERRLVEAELQPLGSTLRSRRLICVNGYCRLKNNRRYYRITHCWNIP